MACCPNGRVGSSVPRVTGGAGWRSESQMMTCVAFGAALVSSGTVWPWARHQSWFGRVCKPLAPASVAFHNRHAWSHTKKWLSMTSLKTQIQHELTWKLKQIISHTKTTSSESFANFWRDSIGIGPIRFRNTSKSRFIPMSKSANGKTFEQYILVKFTSNKGYSRT